MNTLVFVGIVSALVIIANRRLKTLTMNLEQRITNLQNNKG